MVNPSILIIWSDWIRLQTHLKRYNIWPIKPYTVPFLSPFSVQPRCSKPLSDHWPCNEGNDNLCQVSRDKWDDAGSKRGIKAHICLISKPYCSEQIADRRSQHHADKMHVQLSAPLLDKISADNHHENETNICNRR